MYGKVLMTVLFSALAIVPTAVFGTPAAGAEALESRQAVDNIVYVTDASKFWYVSKLISC